MSRATPPGEDVYSHWHYTRGSARLVAVYPTEAEARKSVLAATDGGDHLVIRGGRYVITDDPGNPDKVVFRRSR